MKGTAVEDVPPMATCDATGSTHKLMLVIPGSDDGQITAICKYCGAVRRVPADGQLDRTTIDDLDVAEIEARILGRHP